MGKTARRLEAAGPPDPPSIREYPLIVDTDIGGDPDDMFALVIAAREDPYLALVVTSDEHDGQRARLARHVLDLVGSDIPVMAGADLGNTKYLCFEGLIPDMVGRQSSKLNEAVIDVIHRAENKVRWLGIGPMTNLAVLLREHNHLAKKIHLVQMGGAINYRKPGVAEHNFRLDPHSAEYVLPQVSRPELVLSDATFRPEIQITENSALFDKLKKIDEPWSRLLVEHCRQFFNRHYPGTMMHDPLTLTVAMELPFAQGGFGRITVDPHGLLTLLDTAPLSTTAKDSETDAFYTTSALYGPFMKWLEKSLLSEHPKKTLGLIA